MARLPLPSSTLSLKAVDKGKIKIRKVDDNTAANVEILVHLAPGTSSDKTIDALYAFTDCEVSISPNCCVIDDSKPHFLTVSKVLKKSADNTLGLLKQELEIKKGKYWNHSISLPSKRYLSKNASIKTKRVRAIQKTWTLPAHISTTA